ncbi:MAG TPA: hypothetical protein VHD62_09615 [Opitutaceae bacterium]|nr:hypothetical protein [Opitutaceae bacterium]
MSQSHTLVARSGDGRTSLWLHRDHDFPWLEYPRQHPVACLGLTALESPALGRFLRALRVPQPLTLDVMKVRLVFEDVTFDDVLIVVRSGPTPVIAHLPKLPSEKEAQTFFEAMPAVPLLALGEDLLSREGWVECHTIGDARTAARKSREAR